MAHDKLSVIKSALPGLNALSRQCKLCGHKCGASRLRGEKGACLAGQRGAVYSYSPHPGEEPPLSGTKGSGTIFFTHCNMKCVYCQNFRFSQEEDFDEITNEELARRMLELMKMGCHNINLVSPTHYAAQAVHALQIAIENQINLPVVYNTGGYDSIELIKLLDGIVDIYLPDMRYAQNETAEKYSSAPNYAGTNRIILKEMARQVGELKLNSQGIAEKGLIVRLLILPNNISDTIETLRFLKEELSPNVYLSIMSQYHPSYRAKEFPELERGITKEEYDQVVNEVGKLGFNNGWIQGYQTNPYRFLGTRIKPGRFTWTTPSH